MSTPCLLLATSNLGKRAEFAELLPGLRLLTLAEVGIDQLEEPHADFVANALAKSTEASRRSGLPTLADDSGLSVDALAGAPGVFSARFGGEPASDAANRGRLLRALEGVPISRRGARFRCVLALSDVAGPLGAATLVAQGTVDGRVAVRPVGEGGFGYDPLFVPLGSERTLAEMSAAEKCARSHRAVAVRGVAAALRAYLRRRR